MSLLDAAEWNRALWGLKGWCVRGQMNWSVCLAGGMMSLRKGELKEMDNWTVKTFKTESLESECDLESCSAFRTLAKSIFCVVGWMVLANVNDSSPEAQDRYPCCVA
jgi:hypothetical protein